VVTKNTLGKSKKSLGPVCADASGPNSKKKNKMGAIKREGMNWF